jgi:signal transduction histidine kinase
VPRFDAEGIFAGYIGSAVCITERKRAEEALSTLNRKLIEAHEEERTWIARELHDDINQRVALFGAKLHDIGEGAPGSGHGIRREIEAALEEIQALGNEIQALSHRLHPSKLEYLGLSAAASSMCRELSRRHNVNVGFSAKGISKELSKEISLGLFRVLQEALQNGIKYSDSRQFEVSLTGTPSEINLAVRDWGNGFDPEEAKKKGGLGLISMEERLRLLGGSLRITSQPQSGTVVHAVVPLVSQTKSANA